VKSFGFFLKRSINLSFELIVVRFALQKYYFWYYPPNIPSFFYEKVMIGARERVQTAAATRVSQLLSL